MHALDLTNGIEAEFTLPDQISLMAVLAGSSSFSAMMTIYITFHQFDITIPRETPL